MRYRHSFSWLATLLLLQAGPTHAGLGETLERLETDATQMQARRLEARSSLPAGQPAGASLTRHTFLLPDGGTAVEYADSQGRVFAVSWNAPTMPDLATLLGSYKARLDQAQARQPDRLRSARLLRVSEGDWVVVSSGHLRAFRGASYLPAWLPAGFDLQELER